MAPLDPASNVATIYTAANYYNARQFFAALHDADDDSTDIGLPTIISDDEGNEGETVSYTHLTLPTNREV